MLSRQNQNVVIELSAVIVAVTDNEPLVMAVPPLALPSGPFSMQHRTLEQGLRAWVKAQSGLSLGYVEQLYTFADRDRTQESEDAGLHVVSIGYLALTRAPFAKEGSTPNKAKKNGPLRTAAWTPWYDFFPWEDHRQGVPQAVTSAIAQGLVQWKNAAPDAATRRARDVRIAASFPKDARQWNEDRVLQRYELLWEAGLLEETRRGLPLHQGKEKETGLILPGHAMAHDHRRILATGIARLRAKIKYRPVVFELMPSRFTLLQLQSTVEALAGLRLHKQNFRRLVQGQGLVIETSGHTRDTRGRPAQLFAFRPDVLRERAAAGTKLPRSS
jgi:hypothetical protein